jgi:hypothetical protein
LYDAAEKGDMCEVIAALEEGANVNWEPYHTDGYRVNYYFHYY